MNTYRKLNTMKSLKVKITNKKELWVHQKPMDIVFLDICKGIAPPVNTQFPFD
jgi:hypothetical protein